MSKQGILDIDPRLIAQLSCIMGFRSLFFKVDACPQFNIWEGET